jgi:glycosyltransferase involved in cell wall biosynthesis
LKVALATLYPLDLARIPGGVRTVTFNLVQGLRQWPDLDMHVIHCHSDVDCDRDVVHDGVSVHYRTMPRRRLVPNLLMAIPRVEHLLRQIQPDLVNAHVAHHAVAALRAGYPTVFTIHGVSHREAQVYTSTWFDRSRFLLERVLHDYAMRHVRDVVAISPYIMEEYRHRTHARFHRIDNPLLPEFFAVPDLAEEGRLLYVGTIDQRKNVIDLLRAMVIVRSKMPDVHLRIAGRTTNVDYGRQVQEFVASQGLQRNVEFLGLLDQSHLLDEYARCTAVVLASLQETAPMAVIEAMAAGKPVVATRVGGVTDLVEDGRSGLTVETRDVAGLARCLLNLLADPALRRSMGQRGSQLAQRFRVETVATAYRQLYYDIVGRAIP